jgi:hypothetical protein
MKDLLTRALDAHGGLSRWQEIEAFQLKVSIGGGLCRLKGLPDGLRDVTLRIQAHRPIVTITQFGGEARTGHFRPERVWIEDANGGVVEERATPRASFAGHVLTILLRVLAGQPEAMRKDESSAPSVTSVNRSSQLAALAQSRT